MHIDMLFESLVSFEGCKTEYIIRPLLEGFESLVSFEGCKTILVMTPEQARFESLVSFEGCKTSSRRWLVSVCLRVL